MLDWQGLLKFSLKYSDGTKKSEFKVMNVQDKKFLEEALNQFCNSQIKRIQQIMRLLSQQNAVQRNNQQILEELQELLESLDKGGLLYKLGGHIPLLKIIFYSKHSEDIILSLQILTSANQNDAYVQNQSINTGALQLIELIQKQTNMRIKQNMMSTVSSIIRGENLEAKRIFIRIHGLQVLKKLLSEEPSQRLTNKINTLLRDLLYYDEFLHQTYKDLSSFSNTAGLKVEKQHTELTYDPNEEKLKENLKPENEKFKGAIANFMKQNNEIKEQYEKWLKQELQNEKL